MKHFDASEVQEIGIGDKNYPELLKRIRKPPKALRIRGNPPPNQKIIAISGSRKTEQQALDTAYRIGKMLAEHGYTVVTGVMLRLLRVHFQSVAPLWVSFRVDSNPYEI